MAVTPIYEVNANNNSFHNVSSNATADRTNDIRTLLDAVRNRGNYQGGTVHFPAGIYNLEDNVFSGFDLLSTPVYRNTRLTLRGDGPGATIFKFRANLPANTFAFDISGNGGTAALGFAVNNVTFEGDSKTGGWFRFNNAGGVLFDRVHFAATAGYAIDATDWVNSTLHDCHFVTIGASSGAKTAIRFGAGCGNLRVLSTRWEFSPYGSCYLGASSGTNINSVRFSGCKWNGNASVSQPQVYALNAKELSFRGCRFTNSGSDAIQGSACTGMVVTGCSFDDAAGYAVNLSSSSDCIVLANNIAAGANPTPPLNGNTVAGTAVYKRNAVLPTDTNQ